VRRIQCETLEPISVVARHIGLSAGAAERAIIRGCAGVYLDGVHDPQLGWLSTIPAALRFAHAAAEAEGTNGGPRRWRGWLAARGLSPAGFFADGGGI
jgi:hypothetical protein